MEITEKENEVILDLYKHDVAACDIYKEVLLHVKDPVIRKKLNEFLHDHETHVNDLEKAYEQHVGEPPARGIDIKGTLMFGYTSIRSITGQEGALKALHSAEKIILQRYREAAAGKEWSPNVAQIINKDFADEKKHYAFLQEHI